MATVNEVFQKLDDWAPFETQMSFDNSGLLVGRGERTVTGVLVALDVTLPVVEEARRLGCDLILAHHPVIFDPVRRITGEDPNGRILLALAEYGIAAICAHTNLDAAEGGVNDCLAQRLALKETSLLEQSGVDRAGRPYGIGKVGDAHRESTAGEYAAFVKQALNAASVRFVDAGRPVRRVAVGGGSCGSMLMDAVKAGCDTFVTADVKYNIFLDAKALGINLMDAGHYATEQVVCPALVDFVEREFPELSVHLTQVHPEVYQEAWSTESRTVALAKNGKS